MVTSPVNDYGTGLLGAFGVLLGLKEARSTGKAVRVAGSLARTASFIQSEELTAALKGTDATRPESARIYKCTDGWVRAQVNSPIWTGQVEDRLKNAARMTCEEAAAAFGQRDAVVTIERTLASLQSDRILDDAGLRFTWNHPAWGTVHQAAAATDSSASLSRSGWPAPDPGQHAEEILSEIGYSTGEVAALMKNGVIHEKIPLFGKVPA